MKSEENTHSDYPFDVLDASQMNRILRHRLRNLCAGFRMALELTLEQIGQSHPQIGERCSLMLSDIDDLLGMTEHLDLLLAELPAPEPLALREIVAALRKELARRFPHCCLEMHGPQEEVMLPQGAWFLVILRELLLNAGEAAGRDGRVEFSWQIRPSLQFEIVNRGAWPADVPLMPPRPFLTKRSRHEGIGLSIAHRFALALGAELRIDTELPDAVCVRLSGGVKE
jgi:signal transduction histidine kinase